MDDRAAQAEADRSAPEDGLVQDLAVLLVAELQLEGAPGDIDPDAPLFGEGLGLDSIDALELAVAISKRYGVEIKSDDARNHRIFASLRNLAGHVARHARERPGQPG